MEGKMGVYATPKGGGGRSKANDKVDTHLRTTKLPVACMSKLSLESLLQCEIVFWSLQ